MFDYIKDEILEYKKKISEQEECIKKLNTDIQIMNKDNQTI